MKALGVIAGQPIPFEFRFAEAGHFLRDYLIDGEPGSEKPVSISQARFAEWAAAGNSIDGYGEFCLLCEHASEYLLLRDGCIIHAAALSWGGRAWLIAAGTGVGKSTLCKSLTDAWPEEFAVINGDKPALRLDPDLGVMVCPSPWNGKENWHGAPAAPLGGVFLLRRGEEPGLTVPREREAALRIYLSVFQSFTDEAVIRSAGAVTERILRSVPVWSLRADLSRKPAELVHQQLSEALRNEL